ncbi:MAG: hypothetical protein J7515_16590 [Caulobacter sp.]|nr:hypothetical protein [Caulobacter sp.]
MERIFSLEAILGSLAFGVAGALVALIVRLVKGDGSAALWRVLETFLTATFGAFLARTFISIMLSVGGDSDAAVTVTSLLFFIWPGVVNLISLGFGHPVIGVEALLWIALVVGGLVGLFDGLWATHKWAGLGAPAFLLDVTWGLGGNTNGVLMHLINFAWADHGDGPDENRHDAHRYKQGFAIRSGFAFTQGAVMSNTDAWDPTTDLFKHETIHIWQNRLLGPFFWFSYAGWMLVTLIPALIAGLIDSSRRIGDAITWWTYFDNPWEVMAYGIANPTDRTGQQFMDGSGTVTGWVCWPWPLAIVTSVIGVVGLGAAFVAIMMAGYG